MSDLEQRSLGHFLAQAGGTQWKAFLTALSLELQAQMPVEELRAFFFLLGRRMAHSAPLKADSLAGLERAINAYLAESQLGWAAVDDRGDNVEIAHACAPLRQVFGAESLLWSSGLLEGLYAEWLDHIGAGPDLSLNQIAGPEGACDVFRFRLSRPPLQASPTAKLG